MTLQHNTGDPHERRPGPRGEVVTVAVSSPFTDPRKRLRTLESEVAEPPLAEDGGTIPTRGEPRTIRAGHHVKWPSPTAHLAGQAVF